MDTRITDDVPLAANLLGEGLLVAFPTETVYGLGADATDPQAIQKLFLAKGRPNDNPLIVHLGSMEQLPQAALEISHSAQCLLEAFSPGPISVVVKKHPHIAAEVCAGLDTVGIRIPDHPQAGELLRLVNRPIAAPSANLSGRPSSTTWKSVREDLDGRIDCILKGTVPRIGIESTVVDCTGEVPVILRAGAVTWEQLKRVLPKTVSFLDANAGDSQVKKTLPSPGLRHPHYQPRANVNLVERLEALGSLSQAEAADAAFIGFSPAEVSHRFQPPVDRMFLESSRFGMFVEFVTMEEYARGFYEALREADRRGLRTIYMQLVPKDSLGAALRDRQLRSAGEQGW